MNDEAEEQEVMDGMLVLESNEEEELMEEGDCD